MQVTLRTDSVEIAGYVNAVGRESRVLRNSAGEYFTETIQPGAFARALMRGKRRMLLNHDETRVLGEEGDNLQLKEDAVGLYARADVTDAEVIEKARSRELRGWSFGFRPLRQRTEDNGGIKHRIVEDMELTEVSIIDQRKMPAYAATSVFTRDDEPDNIIEYRMMDMQEVEMRDAASEPSAAKPAGTPPDLTAYEKVLDELRAVEH